MSNCALKQFDDSGFVFFTNYKSKRKKWIRIQVWQQHFLAKYLKTKYVLKGQLDVFHHGTRSYFQTGREILNFRMSIKSIRSDRK